MRITQKNTKARSRRSGGRNISGEKLRLGVVLAALALTFSAVTARLWYIQVSQHKRYLEIALKQSTGKIPLQAERGTIYDRTGRPVAHNVVRAGVFVSPRSAEDAKAAGRYLDKLFSKRRGYHQREHKITRGKFRWIRRGIDDALARKIRLDAPAGVFVMDESGREYPYGLVGKQILGYTDIDNNGISGVESRFDEDLKGVDGKADIQRDGLRNIYKVDENPLVKPQPGQSLILTVDWEFQEIVEEELRAAVEEFNAQGASALFVDCATGEILSAAHYDPTEKHPGRPSKLKSITDSFEPGSIYKIITAAGVLDGGIATPDRLVYCEKGKWRLGRRTLHDDKELEDVTFHQTISKSSNIGVGKLAIELGGEGLIGVSQKFGIGQKTRVDFPGEQAGVLHTDMRWSDYNIAALSIGHSVTVTPIQMAMAIASIANGGSLYRPHLLRGVVSANGITEDNREAEFVCRTMKSENSELLRAMLEDVVDTGGTAPPTKSAIVSIAGKTGTAEVPRPDGKGYFKNKFIASFVGYFPTDEPKVAGIVIMDRPEPIHYGGYTSGPAFKRMAERYAMANPKQFSPASHQLLVSVDGGVKGKPTPDLMGMDVASAHKKAARAGSAAQGALTEGRIVWQFPPADAPNVSSGPIAALSVPSFTEQVARANNPDGNKNVKIPVLVGLTVRQAAMLLAQMKLQFQIEGIGRITDQIPESGSIISRDETITLRANTVAAS